MQQIITPSINRFDWLFSDKQQCNREKKRLYPLWMMRQAGRYLPEYHDLKGQAGSFTNACKSPAIASEITLQPLRRFELDAAIIFSDILFILESFGFSVNFTESGPKITMPLSLKEHTDFFNDSLEKDFLFLTNALLATREQLTDSHKLIGFCGAPWTVSLYALDPKRSPLFSKALEYCYQEPEETQRFLDALAKASAHYLALQVKAGANLVMVFDSWFLQAPQRLIKPFVLKSMETLLSHFKRLCPKTPLIYYPKGGTSRYYHEPELREVDIFGCDLQDSLQALSTSSSKIFQGNIDHRLLLCEPDCIKKEVFHFLSSLQSDSIINLSHGILKQTPLLHVQTFVEAIRSYENLKGDLL